MAIDLIFSPATPNNPFEIARRALLAEIAKLDVPAAIESTPIVGQIEDIGDHVRAVAAATDRWLKTIGREIRANSYSIVNAAAFEDAFIEAVRERACDEISLAEQSVIEQREAV